LIIDRLNLCQWNTFFYNFLITPCDFFLVIIKGTLGGFDVLFLYIFFCGRYPGGSRNPGCWDRNPAPYHFATLTPYLSESTFLTKFDVCNPGSKIVEFKIQKVGYRNLIEVALFGKATIYN